jgi:catechol 2,3-dioxygenase
MTHPYGVVPPSYRLPGEAHVGAVRLQVADLQRSIEYYQRVIGLRLLDASGADAVLGPRGPDTPLVRLQERRGVRLARGEFGLYHFAILLPGRPALGRFAGHLVAQDQRAGSANHFVSESFYLTDPDGLGIEVYADRPRDTWEHRGRELVMGTEALDVRAVLAEAGDAPWDGAPEGTTMGHMHLHVGDLREAEAFYHAALGFDKMVWSYPGALFLAAGGYHHHLGTNTWSRGPSASDDQARLLDWELVMPSPDDVAAAANSIEAAGHEARAEGAAIVVRDPWGTALRLVPRR